MSVTTTEVSTKVFDGILRHAEKIRNDGNHRVETVSPGDAWAQGDLLILCLAELPHFSVRLTQHGPQLAPGDTQGSRHVLDSLDGIALYTATADPTPLDGPIIEAGRRFSITHPEHGDVSLPAGVYAVIYQRAFADELKRQLD